MIIAAIVKKWGRGDGAIVGKGWGAVMALLFLNAVATSIGRIVLADLPLNWDLSADPSIQAALSDSGQPFQSAELALAYLRQLPEFAGLPENAIPAFLASHIRASGNHFRLNYDQRLIQSLSRFAGRSFDLEALIRKIEAPVLLIGGKSGRPPIARQRFYPESTIADLTSDKPVHFALPRQLLLVLGFLTTAVLPLNPRSDKEHPGNAVPL